MSFHVETNQKTVWPLTWYLRAALLHKMMKCLFCCRGPTEAGCCVVVLSSFHFVPNVWVTKAVGESAACAGGFQAIGSSVRQQQESREQSYGSVLLLSLRPHLRLHICLIKRKQEVKIKMLHSSNYRFDRGQNQPAKAVSNIRTGEQNLTVKDASPAHWAALENMKECIDF